MNKNNNNKSIIITTTYDDRITQLPDFILHHIMSFLYSLKEHVRMSVLSKKWFSLTASFPIFNFIIGRFTQALRSSAIPSSKHNDLFFKYVEYTTSRFCHQNVTSAHTFTLLAELQTPTQVNTIDKCLHLILKQRTQDLVIYIIDTDHSSEPMPKYCLPNILLSASSLTSLMLLRCALPSSLMVDVFKFSLKLLHLNRVPIDDEVITRLTANCPLLEELSMDDCYGFKRFCIYWHQNLQNVQIWYTHEVEIIDIEAPNLWYLNIYNSSKRVAPCMNLASCKKLTTLYYHGYPSPSFADFSTHFPFLEDLSLDLPDECKKLKLTSRSLRRFVLYSQCDLEEIVINTPNLLLFVYSGIPLMQYSSLKDDSNACMQCDPRYDVDIPWFQNLRRFLDKKSTFSVLKLRISAVFIQSFIDVEELKMIQSPPPYELEHVDLELCTRKEISVAVYLAVVDVVLRCFRPRSLTLQSKFYSIYFEEQIHVVKFAYEKLLQQENQDEDETGIQIVVCSSFKDKKRFNDLNSLLTEFPYGMKTITFVKEKVVQEAR